MFIDHSVTKANSVSKERNCPGVVNLYLTSAPSNGAGGSGALDL